MSFCWSGSSIRSRTNDAAFDRIVVAYSADTTAAGGTAALRTDHQPDVTFGIAQANLSTETRPPNRAAAAFTPKDSALMLNTPSAFIRLLWEASITRAGGFFLYYYDRANGRGLPDRLFNDRGEAQVSLIVLYVAGSTPSTSDRVSDYMTSVVTGLSIDSAQSVVFAEASPMEQAVSSDDGLSLAQLAELTYSDVGDLAVANAGLRLSSTVRLSIANGVYQADPSGIGLPDVAAYLGTDIAHLNAVNPQWGGNLPDPLPGLTAIYVPAMGVLVGSDPTLTLADVSEYYRVNLTSLAYQNADKAGLFAGGQDIQITGGPVTKSATVLPGAAAVGAARPRPAPVPLRADQNRADTARCCWRTTSAC